MRYPLVKQNGLKECGPCSLASIIIYYHGYYSVDTLSDMMHTTKDGTTAFDLIETARRVGFMSEGKKINSIKEAFLPCIAYVTLSNTYNHFIVIYKVAKDKVLIGDPIDKVKYMSTDSFNNIWNNIIIELRPIKKIAKENKKNMFNLIGLILKRNISYLLFIILLNLIYLLLSISYTLIIKYIIDNITLISKRFLIMFLLFVIIKIVVLYIRNKVLIKFNKVFSITLTNEVIESLISLPYPYYRNHQTGEVVSRLSDLDYIKNFISSFLMSLLDIPLLIIFLLIIYCINKSICFWLLILVNIFVIFYSLISFKLSKIITSFQNNKASFNSLLVENISGFETIKGLNILDLTVKKLKEAYLNVEKSIKKYNELYNIKQVLIAVLTYFGIFIIIIYGLILFNNNQIELSSIVMIYVLYSYLLEPISTIIELCIKYKEANNAKNRIESLLTSKNEIKKSVNNYNIIINDLSYKMGYKEILHHINLKINKGEKVFITGQSGSGKSTLVKIIKGYYKSSNIFLGNDELIKCNLDMIIYISQNEVLFNDTIKNNLMSNDLRDIVNTCLISNDLNLYVEENGFNLSGGEKAKIVLGRSLLKNFEVLIIDEGLSEIDLNQERIILKNIFKIYRNKTIIVISHRLDNLDLYDHFIEISNGLVLKDEYKHNN